MSDVLVIEIRDSHKNPRCSVLWRWGGESATYHALKLSYAIGSLSDDSTTEQIIHNILEEFPEVGVPRSIEFYKRNNLDMTEYAIATKYADDLELPDGNTGDGVLAFTNNAVFEFSDWADTLLYFELGNVTMADCVFDEVVEDFFGLTDFDPDSDDYRETEEEIKEVEAHAYVMSEKEFQKPITTMEQKDKFLKIIDKYEWIRHGNDYCHIEGF